MKYIWEIKSTDMGYAIECGHCKRKIGVKDAIMGDKKFDTCPFCGKEMDMENFDYDKLYELAQSEPDVVN
jgi:uncharacterized CHY-type Zn-finger protein